MIDLFALLEKMKGKATNLGGKTSTSTGSSTGGFFNGFMSNFMGAPKASPLPKLTRPKLEPNQSKRKTRVTKRRDVDNRIRYYER